MSKALQLVPFGNQRPGRNAIFLGRGVYDFAEASMVEGLVACGFKIFGSRKANSIAQPSPLSDLEKLARDPDTLIIFNKENFKLSRKLGTPKNQRIFIDGRDDPYLYIPGILASRLYAKRELLSAWPIEKFPKVTTFVFGIEQRYPLPTKGPREIDLYIGLNLATNACRKIFVSAVQSFRNRNQNLRIVVDSTGERAYDNRSGEPIDTPRYYQYLKSSKFVLSLHGAGQDCARFWETLSAGACPLSQRMSIHYPMKNDLDFPAFSSVKDLEECLEKLLPYAEQAFESFSAKASEIRQMNSTKSRVQQLLHQLENTKKPSWALLFIYVVAGAVYNIYSKLYMLQRKYLHQYYVS